MSFVRDHIYELWILTEVVVLVLIAVLWPWPPQLPREGR